ncbi:MAG: leucine-rich repeat protein [Cyanobacteria bacterium J06626_4]
MARDEAYQEAERCIEAACQEGATELNLSELKLTELPEEIASLAQLKALDLSDNQLTELPKAICNLKRLELLYAQRNQLLMLPEGIDALCELKELLIFNNGIIQLPKRTSRLKKLQVIRMSRNPLSESLDSIQWELMTALQEIQIEETGLRGSPFWLLKLPQLRILALGNNEISRFSFPLDSMPNLEILVLGGTFSEDGIPLEKLPEEIGKLANLRMLYAASCELTDLPLSVSLLKNLELLDISNNPLNLDLAAAYEQDIHAVKQYLRARAEGEISLNQAKLILVGEGEVGKSCLLGALRGDDWLESRPTTHGIEIKSVIVNARNSETEITLNGWDFGGQRVYRPTHQLFFSSTAMYLVVWKPREGPQQGFVKEWITLIKHREPDAKVLVVATHGGPGQRQPDIDRQELIDLFGHDTVLGFHHIDSKEGTGITKLREAIANTAATLPGMGRKVPTKWQELREQLEDSGQPYMPYRDVIALCEEHGLEGSAAELFVRVSHTLGYLIHYHYDPILQDIVILQPDWLAKAISFVLDDDLTRQRNGLVEFEHLSQLWSYPPFAGETGYPPELHPVFLRLMERFDLS